MIERYQDTDKATGLLRRSSACALAVSAVMALGGCSADLGRFDFPSSNLNARDGSSTALVPPEPVGGGSYAQAGDREPEGDGGRSSYGGGTYVPPRASKPSRGVEMAALEPPRAESTYGAGAPASFASGRGEAPPASFGDRGPRAGANTSNAALAPASRPGSTIEVQRGDTLYGIARRHGVKVNALMAANNLRSADIKPGQQLRLPDGSEPVAAPVAARSEPAPAPQAFGSAEAPAAPAAPPADWNGSHTVQPGDNLYGIARQYRVRVADLQSANGITNPRQLKPGMTLHVPGVGAAAGAGATPHAAANGRESEPAAPRAIASTTQPTLINGARQVAALDTGRASDAIDAPAATPPAAKPVQTAVVVPAATSALKLRWPAKGKVLAGFGQRSDGTHNDGINIAVPQGADVHAAEEGEVAYAGSELKGYGNLVLIRHDNGWVTAYAHNDQLLVKRGDKVKRGDVVAKAGKSGEVDQPQLHFELRQGSKPVDPLPFLERL